MPTPEEIAAFRARLAGGSDVTAFDRKASDVAGSLQRLGQTQFAGIAGSVGNPMAPMIHAAGEQAALAQGGGLGGLSHATQAAIANRPADPPTELQPMATTMPDVQAAPTLKDQLMAKLQGRGGGGGPGLGGLYSEWRTARGSQLGDFETDKKLASQMGDDRSTRVEAVAMLQQQQAAKMQRDAEVASQEEAKAAQRHEAFLQRNADLADDIGRQQIDPKRLVNNQSTGEKIGTILGAALGGLTSGVNGGPNQFLQQFDREIDRDIAAQQAAIDNKKTALGARQSVFGQMMQETGDRRLAAMQTRNLMYESAKQDIMAQADQLGIPEIRTNAEQAVSEIQHRQDALNAQLKGEDLQRQQAAAAAAASSQRAAEENAWKRQMEVAKLGLERDKVEIDKVKALGGGAEDIQKQAQQLGEKLAEPKLANGRAAIENSKTRLSKVGAGEGLPGVGAWGDFRERLLGTRLGLSEDERLARGDWEKMKLSYQSQITGSGASDGERAMLSKAFEGAKTPAEQRQAIAEADALFQQIERRHKASVDPRAKALYEQRLGNVSDERAKQFKQKLGGY